MKGMAQFNGLGHSDFLLGMGVVWKSGNIIFGAGRIAASY